MNVITSDKDRWVNVMMKHELEMIPSPKSPLASGAATFFAFLAIGLVPLLVYVWDYFTQSELNLFLISSLLTSLAFVYIGFIKTRVTQTSSIRGIIETLLLGISAAIVAYTVGLGIDRLIS